MAYKTYVEQISEHINHLQLQNLNIETLIVDSGRWERCRVIGKTTGRGEFCYTSNTQSLSNGLFGLQTSYRGKNGTGSYKTYGLGPNVNASEVKIDLPLKSPVLEAKTPNHHEQASRRAYGFWNHSDTNGTSAYLDRKGVGYYGLRFRSDAKYGDVAIVPMLDETGRLWNYQILNSDGTKRIGKDARTKGLFHKLKDIGNSKFIGIAEGYVTAATCMELSGIPTVCAFSSENLVCVTQLLLLFFPAALIFIFADNDRHLEKIGQVNKGVFKAQEAVQLDKARVSIVIPDFGDYEAIKSASDWNDLVRIFGLEASRVQIEEQVKCRILNDGILRETLEAFPKDFLTT